MNRRYLEHVAPTYLENWANGLIKLSIPQECFQLTRPEVEALEALSWDHLRPADATRRQTMARLLSRLNEAVACFESGAFVRLGSASPKDSMEAERHGLRVSNGGQAFRMLTSGSARIARDLRLALRCDYKPYVFVREWLEFPPWAEFRCFMRDRQLVGISEYRVHSTPVSVELGSHAAPVERCIRDFFDSFAAACHLDCVVFDVVLQPLAGSVGNWRATLLELNPWSPHSDGCLFSWANGNDFDDSFRFRRVMNGETARSHSA